MRQFVALLFAMQIYSFYSQTLTVVDKVTREPLPGVAILLGRTPPVFTNQKGKVDVTAFNGMDSIKVFSSNYKMKMFSFEQLTKLDYKVELEELNISLSEIVVSANRVKEDKLETPNRIQKLNMKEVAFQNPQTTADLLGTGGYAFIQKSQLGGGSPMIRGMATNRVLLVVDGVRMNNAIFRAGNLQQVISLDANALEGAEILFGPGAVMYGSDAIGGVMSFNTLEPKMTDSASKYLFKSNAMIRTSSANSEITGHVDFNFATRRWSFVTSFTRSEYEDLRSGTKQGDPYLYRPKYVTTINNKDTIVLNNDSTLQIGSGYDQTNFMQKIKFQPNRYLEIDYGFHYSQTSSFNRYDRLYVNQTKGPNKNKLRWAEWYYGPQKWNMNRIGIVSTKSNFIFNQLRLIVAMQNFEESRFDREFAAKELRSQRETVRALSVNLDLEKQLIKTIDLKYGAELVHNLIGSEAALTDINTKSSISSVTRYPDGSTWLSTGLYVNFKYRPTKKFIVSAGARFSNYIMKASFDTLIFPFPFKTALMKNRAVNGSVGFVYTPIKSWQVYLNAATGFRAPNIDDMGKVFESTPGYLVVPNPDLKPERSYNIELGTVKTFMENIKVDFTGYYTHLIGAMERKGFTFNGQSTIIYQGIDSKIEAIQNSTKAYVYGVQSGLEFSGHGFGFRLSYSWQKGKEQTTDSLVYYPLRHAAPAFGSTHLSYQYKKIKVDFYGIYNAGMDFEDLALTERVNTSYAKDYSIDSKGLNYSASWYTINFKAAYYVNKNLMLMSGVENITDRLYRPYSSGINAPGRNFIVSIKLRC